MAALSTRAYAGQTVFALATSRTPLAVTVNGVATSAYTFSAGYVTFNVGLAQGDAVNITYTDPAAATTGGTSGTTYSAFGASGSAHAAGLVPDPGATAGATKFLREDGGWAIPAYASYSVFGKSGSTHSTGLVPDPGATVGTAKFLREDGTWVVPTDTDTKYSTFGASGTAHAAGLVPDPGTTAGTTKFLREDGTWVIPSAVKNNAVAAAPTVTDDATQGYSASSSWLHIGTGDMWRCRSATAGAAVWVRVDTADHPGYFAGNKYLPFGWGNPVAGSANAANTIFLAFGVIKQRITLSQLAARITTAATGNFQLASYAHNPATNGPGALIAQTGSGSTGTAAVVNIALTANKALEPGPYWFAVNQDNASAVFMAMALSSPSLISLIGSAADVIPAGTSNGSQSTGLSVAQTFGTWPADLSNATFGFVSVGKNPIIQFLVASVG